MGAAKISLERGSLSAPGTKPSRGYVEDRLWIYLKSISLILLLRKLARTQSRGLWVPTPPLSLASMRQSEPNSPVCRRLNSVGLSFDRLSSGLFEVDHPQPLIRSRGWPLATPPDSSATWGYSLATSSVYPRLKTVGLLLGRSGRS